MGKSRLKKIICSLRQKCSFLPTPNLQERSSVKMMPNRKHFITHLLRIVILFMMKPGNFRKSLAPQKTTIAPAKGYISTQNFTVENTEKVRIPKPGFTSKKLCTILSKLSRTWGQQNCFGTPLKRNFHKFHCLDDSDLPRKKELSS